MQVVRSFVPQDAATVSWSVRAMLVSAQPEEDAIERRMAGIGAQVARVGDLYTALSMVMEDPGQVDMLVVDCDGLGGLAEVRRIVRLMGDAALRVPVILVSQDCQTQIFALERREPTVLRAPLSAVSLRVGFEHVMRGRLAPRYS